MAKNRQDNSAGPDQPGGSRTLRPDRLVEKLIPDPNAYEPTISLAGFVGEGSQPGMWRLYLGPELSEFVEFTEQDVVNTESIPEDQSPLGGTRVWLRAATTLRYTRITSQQVQADFLQGAITAGFMENAASNLQATAARSTTGAVCPRNYVCTINPRACQVRTERCGSAFCGPGTGPFCPTGVFISGC